MISGIRRAGRGALGFGFGVLLIASTSQYSVRPAEAAPGRTAHALLFVTDGGQPDLFRKFAREGALPTYARMEAEGSMAAGGMAPQLSTSTRASWQTLSTGAWAGTHASLNNVFTRNGLSMGQSYPAGTYSPLEAETLAETAEAAGLKVLLYDWNSSDQPPIAGPTVKYWRTYTRAGGAQNYADLRAVQGAAAWGLMFDNLALAPAPGGPPGLTSYSPLVAGSLCLSAFDGPAYENGVRLYDSTDSLTAS
ncbi:MAG: alkaline phosphatase family protein [Anaerolineales bacterium]|nr:alkaline phosphatase family protein [Anaerolineales bacterium]